MFDLCVIDDRDWRQRLVLGLCGVRGGDHDLIEIGGGFGLG